MPPIKSVSLVVMAAFYVLAGVLHFVKRDFYVAIVPPALPNPVAVVLVSGVVEIVLGLALLVPSLRVAAASGCTQRSGFAASADR